MYFFKMTPVSSEWTSCSHAAARLLHFFCSLHRCPSCSQRPLSYFPLSFYLPLMPAKSLHSTLKGWPLILWKMVCTGTTSHPTLCSCPCSHRTCRGCRPCCLFLVHCERLDVEVSRETKLNHDASRERGIEREKEQKRQTERKKVKTRPPVFFPIFLPHASIRVKRSQLPSFVGQSAHRRNLEPEHQEGQTASHDQTSYL